MDPATIERNAMQLSVADRAALIDRLLQTLNLENPDRMENWALEAERRLRAFERSEISDVDGPTAVAAIREHLR